jgi:hypothetical protein
MKLKAEMLDIIQLKIRHLPVSYLKTSSRDTIFIKKLIVIPTFV